MLKNEQQIIERLIVENRFMLEQLESEKHSLPRQEENELPKHQSDVSDLTQEMVRISGMESRIIRASRSGFISNPLIREGQQVGVNDYPS